MEFGVKEVESASVKIGSEEVKKAYEVLTKYKAGKVNLEKHIIENERWFKMRQWEFLRKKDDVSPEPSSAWLFNVIINKHADCMDNFPCPMCCRERKVTDLMRGRYRRSYLLFLRGVSLSRCTVTTAGTS